MKNVSKLRAICMVVIICNILIPRMGFAQSPDWLWGVGVGNTGNEEAYGMAVDGSGNVIVGGYFSSATVNFGSTTLTSSGGADVFVTKYDGTGNVLWSKSGGGSSDDDEIYSVASDASGNVYTTGFFLSSSATFGSVTLTNAGSGSSGDMFVVKYNNAGTVQWAKRAGNGNGDESGFSVAADGSGNVYVAGNFSGASITFGSTTLTNAGASLTQDLFLVKYNSSGTVQWSKRAGGIDDDIAYCVTTDLSGNVILTGWFQSSSITFGTTTLTNPDSTYKDVFVTKYDGNGNVLWAKRAGGLDDDQAKSVSADASGNVFVTGLFRSSSITFGSTTLNNPSVGYSDIFVAKYDGNGNVLWANRAGGIDDEEALSVATDGAGSCVVTGWFLGTDVTFGSSTLTNTSPGTADLFVVKYNNAGSLLWTQSAGGTYDETPDVVATDASGDIYVAGYYLSSTLLFGPSVLTNAGSQDMFLAKLTSSVGIKQPFADQELFNLYSNPVTTTLTIKVSESIKEKINLQIFDAVGKIVSNEILFTNDHAGPRMIDVSGLQPGIYFLQLMAGTEMVVKKFVKE